LTIHCSSPILDFMLTADAETVLRRANEELRGLIQQALAQGRYGDVAAIARMADGVEQLAALGQTEDVVGGEPSVPTTAGSDTQRRTISPVTEASRRRSFPRFEREGDRLVKIAWSKRDRAEYEHKASRRIVDLLVDVVKRRKGVGARFVPPDVFPLRDPKTKRDVPSYQAYLTLGWLCHEGVMVKHGRDGYSLKPTAATSERLEQLWDALPARTR